MCKNTNNSLYKESLNEDDDGCQQQGGGGCPFFRFCKRLLFTAAALAAFVFVVLPSLISEAAGGFTAKYTSNPAGFSLNKIPNMTGKVAIVTGGNTGIGYETAKQLVFAGAQVIFTSRSQAKADAAASKIVEAYAQAHPEADTVKLLPMVCDQSSLASVQNFATQVKKLKIPIHLLLLNAGVMKSPGAQFVGKNMTYGFELTNDGFEQHIGVNHIAHFYMTQLLTEPLLAGKGRVVSVSSSAHSGGYPDGIRPDTWSPLIEGNEGTPEWYEDGVAYGQSKLSNILFAKEFAKRMNGTGVTAYSVHPGVINSDLARYMKAPWEKDLEEKGALEKLLAAVFGAVWIQSNMKVEDGALTQLYVATAPEEELTNGAFYWPIGLLMSPDHPSLIDEDASSKLQSYLWEESEKAIAKALKRKQ